MDGRSYIVLETKREDRVYRFEIPFGALYEEAEEVAKEFVFGVLEMQKQAAAQAEQLKQSEPVEPELMA